MGMGERLFRIMKSVVLFLLAIACSVGTMQGQDIVESLQRNVPGQGRVTIHQDASVAALLGKKVTDTGERKVIKTHGYRVQAYAGNNTRRAMNEAHEVAAQIKERFPELPIYTMFNSPRWLCRVGDFRSIEEADATMRKLRATGVFKEVSIVRDQINIEL